MPNPHGMPIWYELMTSDQDAAQAFYERAAGWTISKPENGPPGVDYRMFSAGDSDVGGIMKMPDGAPMPPLWSAYIGVDDVDEATEKAQSLGASVHMPPMDIPNVGRFAFLADPQGAVFYVMRGFSDEDSRSFEPETPGHCSWNELVTSDQTAALDFYGKLFGWEKLGAMPMGDMGDYTFIGVGGTRIGAMMNARDAGAKPLWNFAFTVEDIDKAKEAVEAGGGTITHGPVELPEDSGWLIQMNDPQGAKLMFTGPRR
ncbi:VOC family protein [Fulvimarina sp. MAC8]|uniref:VOC family protein n=1 Tax=Fulvimarina sp. MAC8 TaxID=3162874 RepID=UPI0032EDC9EB